MPRMSDYISTEEAAEMTGFHETYIRRLFSEGRLRGVRPSRNCILILKSDAQRMERNPEGRGRPKHNHNEDS